jgi:phosphoglycerate dehydrogenase-like enzyme
MGKLRAIGRDSIRMGEIYRLAAVIKGEMILKIVADANIPYVSECFSSMGDVTVVSGREMTASAVADADCLLVRSVTAVNSELLAGSRVRFVGTATIGLEHIDVDFLAKKNIAFASAPGSNANSVAEYVVAAMLEAAKKHNFQLEGKSIGIFTAAILLHCTRRLASKAPTRLFI